MSRTDSICSSMHYRAPSRGGRYGSSPQTNAAGHPDRARIQPETVLESEYANRTVTSQRAGSGAVFAVRGSSAKSLWCLNLAESPEIRATFQRDSSRLHSEVRDLSAQPRNRVSVARLSRSWALRAPPSGLGGHPAGGSRRAKRKVPLRCRLCRYERLRRSGAPFWWAQVRPEAPIRLIVRSMCRACGRPQEETLCRNKIRSAMIPPSSSSSAS